MIKTIKNLPLLALNNLKDDIDQLYSQENIFFMFGKGHKQTTPSLNKEKKFSINDLIDTDVFLVLTNKPIQESYSSMYKKVSSNPDIRILTAYDMLDLRKEPLRMPKSKLNILLFPYLNENTNLPINYLVDKGYSVLPAYQLMKPRNKKMVE